MSDILNRVEAVISEKLMATWSSASPLAEAYMLKLSGILAREVVEAMREPTPEMIENGVLAYNLTGIANGIVNTAEDHVAFIFSAMLPDAALKGEAE